MAQEGLDALMNGDVDFDEDAESNIGSETESRNIRSGEGLMLKDVKMSDYKPDPSTVWLPPPPNQEHKIVHQLDDVTKDSESEATKIMNRLESISNFFADSENLFNEIDKVLIEDIEIFSKLNEKFPNVVSFNEVLQLNLKVKKTNQEIVDKLQCEQDEVMMAMDAMQYQDIHRQKIECIINVMRALSHYMSSLFGGRTDDKRRMSSAVHIEGNSTTGIVSNDGIEALIASSGQK